MKVHDIPDYIETYKEKVLKSWKRTPFIAKEIERPIDDATMIALGDSVCVKEDWLAPPPRHRLPALTFSTNRAATSGKTGPMLASTARLGRVRDRNRRDQSVQQKKLKPVFHTNLETHLFRHRISADPCAQIPESYDPPSERLRREQAKGEEHRIAGDFKFAGGKGLFGEEGLLSEEVCREFL